MTRRSGGVKALIVILIILLALLAAGYAAVRIYFPLRYEDSVRQYSEKYGIDPYFVCAVIWTESKFDVHASSGAGAQGLMQLMPETAAWIEKKIDDERVTAENSLEPDINIEMGCWYLRYLMDMFDDSELAAAAYNAGQNKVKEWLDNREVSRDGEVLHDIPYEETRNYVKRVDDAYEVYKFLYNLD